MKKFLCLLMVMILSLSLTPLTAFAKGESDGHQHSENIVCQYEVYDAYGVLIQSGDVYGEEGSYEPGDIVRWLFSTEEREDYSVMRYVPCVVGPGVCDMPRVLTTYEHMLYAGGYCDDYEWYFFRCSMCGREEKGGKYLFRHYP